MDAHECWQRVLDQLEQEMPRSSFDAFVRGSRALGWEGDCLLVRAKSEYAREWLDNRLAQIVAHKIAGIINQADIGVRFVLETGPGDEDDEEDDAGYDEEDGEIQDDEEKWELEVEAEAWDSLYEKAVRPEQAMYLPGYFRHWIAMLGPDLAWFYVGFRQAAYWSSGRRKSEHTGRFSGKKVAALCGVTERTFWNRVMRNETWQKLNGLIRRDGQRYTVAMSLPLTAPDAQSLTRWLLEHLEESGGAEGVLNAACQAPVDELLAVAAGKPTSDAQPATIPRLLQAIFPDLPEATRNEFAERLRMHIMPQRDQIAISIFFLKHVLPQLKAGPAWVYVLLRDRCFVDRAGGGRDTVTVRGGYKEIASWLGVRRPRTVYDWLRDPIARVYLAGSARSDDSNGDGKGWESNPLDFRVLLNDVPAEIVQAAAKGTQGTDAIFSLGLLPVDAIFSDHCREFQCSLTRFSVPIDANFSVHCREFQCSLTRISVFIDAIFSALKPLKPFKTDLKPGKTDQPAQKKAKANAEPVSVGSVGRETKHLSESESWDFDGILERLRVHPASRERLREQRVSADVFLAWLLQAMTMQNVDPVRVAIAWTLNPQKRDQVDANFRMLASAPDKLRRVVQRMATEGGRYALHDDPVSRTYRRLFGDNQMTARTILRLLFGDGEGTDTTLVALPLEANCQQAEKARM